MQRDGFTLIELMIVVVIIGLLAAIAMPQYGSVKDRSYVTSMRSDLRNLAQFQESYFYDNRVYTPDIASLEAIGLQSTTMVSPSLVEATATGWAATTSHTLTDVTCGLFIGNAAPVASATVTGNISCQ